MRVRPHAQLAPSGSSACCANRPSTGWEKTGSRDDRGDATVVRNHDERAAGECDLWEETVELDRGHCAGVDAKTSEQVDRDVSRLIVVRPWVVLCSEIPVLPDGPTAVRSRTVPWLETADALAAAVLTVAPLELPFKTQYGSQRLR